MRLSPPTFGWDCLEPRSAHYVSNGLRLHFVEWGRHEAPVLILIHGGYDNSRSWDPVAHAIAHGFRVIAPDLRGHGESQWSVEGHYALIDHVEDLANLIRHLGIASANVLAHSYGGRVAPRHAGTYRKMVERLVVIEGLGPPRQHRSRWRSTPVARRICEYHEEQRVLAAAQASCLMPLAGKEP